MHWNLENVHDYRKFQRQNYCNWLKVIKAILLKETHDRTLFELSWRCGTYSVPSTISYNMVSLRLECCNFQGDTRNCRSKACTIVSINYEWSWGEGKIGRILLSSSLQTIWFSHSLKPSIWYQTFHHHKH